MICSFQNLTSFWKKFLWNKRPMSGKLLIYPFCLKELRQFVPDKPPTMSSQSIPTDTNYREQCTFRSFTKVQQWWKIHINLASYIFEFPESTHFQSRIEGGNKEREKKTKWIQINNKRLDMMLNKSFTTIFFSISCIWESPLLTSLSAKNIIKLWIVDVSKGFNERESSTSARRRIPGEQNHAYDSLFQIWIRYEIQTIIKVINS